MLDAGTAYAQWWLTGVNTTAYYKFRVVLRNTRNNGGTETNRGSFTMQHYGGMGSGQWSLDITFKFQDSNGNWYLDKTECSLFTITIKEETDSSDVEVAEYKVKTVKDFGVVRFEEFNVFDFNYFVPAGSPQNK